MKVKNIIQLEKFLQASQASRAWRHQINLPVILGQVALSRVNLKVILKLSSDIFNYLFHIIQCGGNSSQEICLIHLYSLQKKWTNIPQFYVS